MLCVGLFFLIGTIGNGYLLGTALILGVLIYSFRHLFLNISVLSQNLKLGINTIVQEFGFHFNADRGLSIVDFPPFMIVVQRRSVVRI